MRTPLATNSGQALLEFVLSSLWVGAALGATVALFETEWRGTRCAYQVFEKAHARLTGTRELPGSGWIRLEESPREVIATASCGRIRQRVRLPRLEAHPW
ncbi:MAG: hypothetical protein NDJ90_12070 [Oligoflexia bacterium]|nr:hypothetical protein [Oligoflexia bacterium]